MNKLMSLYQSYKYSMVRITSKTDVGDLVTGATFHIGDGWLATAAHVVTKGEIEEVVSEYLHKMMEIL